MTVEMRSIIDAIMTTGNGITFRRAAANDAHLIADHRLAMFRDIGYVDTAALNSMRDKFLPWVRWKLASGEYLAWLAAAEGDHVVAGVGLWLMDWPAHMLGSSARRGNILNVYTEPAFRGQGLARVLVEAALHWCRTNAVDIVILHASKQGRALYEKLGFEPSNEMRIMMAGA